MLCSPTHSVHGLQGSVALTTSENVTPAGEGMWGALVGPGFSRLPVGQLDRKGCRPSLPLSLAHLCQGLCQGADSPVQPRPLMDSHPLSPLRAGSQVWESLWQPTGKEEGDEEPLLQGGKPWPGGLAG